MPRVVFEQPQAAGGPRRIPRVFRDFRRHAAPGANRQPVLQGRGQDRPRSQRFCLRWYVPTSSAWATTCPLIACSMRPFAGSCMAGSTVSSA